MDYFKKDQKKHIKEDLAKLAKLTAILTNEFIKECSNNGNNFNLDNYIENDLIIQALKVKIARRIKYCGFVMELPFDINSVEVPPRTALVA